MTEFYNNKPLFFAHRGCLLNKPENTLSSFLESIKIGAQALEIDVMKTKDNGDQIIEIPIESNMNELDELDE